MMKNYQVMINYEESVAVQINAESALEAEIKALKLAENYSGSSYPKEKIINLEHTEYFTDPAEEII